MKHRFGKESGDVPFMGMISQQNNNRIFQPSHHQQPVQADLCHGCQDFPNKNPRQKTIKGMSLLSFFCPAKTGLNASMTVEAAVVLPLFLFFFLNLLEIIEIYRVQTALLAALRETGRELSVYACVYKETAEKEDGDKEEWKALLGDIAFSYLYVKERVERLAGEEYLDASPINGGKEGIWYTGSSVFREKDVIELTAVYQIKPFIRLAGFRPAWFYSRYYGRAWTGYDVAGQENSGEDKEEYVYVTENAQVYHVSRECSHIRLSISECGAEELELLRNEYGDRYTACELCADTAADHYYISRSGDRYHQDLNCGGLKRTVRVMLRSEAEKKYRLCGRCGM